MHSLGHFGTQVPDVWIPHHLQWRVLRYCKQVLLKSQPSREEGTRSVCWGGFAKLANLSPGKGSVGSGLGEGTVTLHNPRCRKEESPKDKGFPSP